jgi:hypothetical protein
LSAVVDHSNRFGFPFSERPDRGMRPDVAVPTFAADIAAGQDRFLLDAIAWCRRVE